jgi:hypothetical protein
MADIRWEFRKDDNNIVKTNYTDVKTDYAEHIPHTKLSKLSNKTLEFLYVLYRSGTAIFITSDRTPKYLSTVKNFEEFIEALSANKLDCYITCDNEKFFKDLQASMELDLSAPKQFNKKIEDLLDNPAFVGEKLSITKTLLRYL